MSSNLSNPKIDCPSPPSTWGQTFQFFRAMWRMTTDDIKSFRYCERLLGNWIRRTWAHFCQHELFHSNSVWKIFDLVPSSNTNSTWKNRSNGIFSKMSEIVLVNSVGCVLCTRSDESADKDLSTCFPMDFFRWIIKINSNSANRKMWIWRSHTIAIV